MRALWDDDGAVIAPPGTLASRILMARMELSASMGEKVSQERLGVMAASYLRRDRPITGATVSRWEAGETVPDLETVKAVAVVCGVDPGWLAYGSASNAPAPRDRITDPVLRRLRARDVGMFLSTEAKESVVRRTLRKSRDWNAKFNKLMRAQRTIRRIKDDGERKARESAWQAAFNALRADLDQEREERSELYLEATKIPGEELKREKARQQAESKRPNEAGDA